MGRSVKVSSRPLGFGQRISSLSILFRLPMPSTSRLPFVAPKGDFSNVKLTPEESVLIFQRKFPSTICRIHDLRKYEVNCSMRSEEHTSELQSHSDLVCRLLLEKKK